MSSGVEESRQSLEHFQAFSSTTLLWSKYSCHRASKASIECLKCFVGMSGQNHFLHRFSPDFSFADNLTIQATNRRHQIQMWRAPKSNSRCRGVSSEIASNNEGQVLFEATVIFSPQQFEWQSRPVHGTEESTAWITNVKRIDPSTAILSVPGSRDDGYGDRSKTGQHGPRCPCRCIPASVVFKSTQGHPGTSTWTSAFLEPACRPLHSPVVIGSSTSKGVLSIA